MLQNIWKSFMRWVRKTFGTGISKPSHRVVTAELPPLDDTDREYLFMQLLEGVAHGWQQPRAVSFFNKIRHRVRKSDWLEWLDRFGNNLLNAPVPNYELAGRMVQLSQLDCGEICDLAGDYGVKLLDRQAEESPGDFLPIMEFATTDEAHPFGTSYGGSVDSSEQEFDDLPPELLTIDDAPLPQAQIEVDATETREITLEEFSAMLHKDPDLVAELAAQFGIETTDPQAIVNAVIAQMQQQVQPISGEINSTPHELIMVPPTPQPPEIEHQSTSSTSPPVQHIPPPPPPRPQKLEYKAEDPWNNHLSIESEASLPETVNLPDRGV